MSTVERTVSGIPVVVLDEVDSTNAEALRRAVGGHTGPLWVIARTQSAGRGRQGRPWVSPPGNLYCSLLVETDLAAGNANGLSFVAALAVHDTVAEFLHEAGGAAELRLKWPNDVLVDGAKLSGILLEGTSTGSGGAGAMAIGMGINVTHHPQLGAYRTTCLANVGVSVSAESVFARLERVLERWIAEWAGGDGFALVRDAWLARAKGIGEEVEVRLPNQNLRGMFVGLDEAGAMVLRESTGAERRIFAGDLVLGVAKADAEPNA